MPGDNKEKELLDRISDLELQIKKLKDRKRYGLVWEEKEEQVVLDCQNKLPILKEVKNKEIRTDKNKPVNILIEGDNYHSLSVLNYTHKGKIDVIYIDPPYNTGATDWKYNNDYVDKNDTYRHSKWLSLMERRLRLARKLLSKSGVLICTIDENEFNRVGLLLEEIFSSYQMTCVTIVHNPAGIQGDNFSYCHEYAFFVYPSGGRYIGYQIRGDDEKDIRNFRDVTGDESLRTAAANCFYPIFVKDKKIIGFGAVSDKNYHPKNINIKKKDGIIEIYPIDPQGIERKWRFARQTVESIKDELEVKYINNRGVYDVIRLKNKFNFKTVWTDSKYSANNHGTQLLNKIIKHGLFSYPKSLYAVIDCLRAALNGKKDAIVLDFFAGSGTTGHAVAVLNKEDNGSRKFILCTNNENKIAEDVCYPRIKVVIKGHKDFTDITGIESNLKYYKTDFVDTEHISKISDEGKIKLSYQVGEMIALRENILDEVEKNDWWQIFSDDQKTLAIYFKEDKSKLQKLVSKLNKDNKKVILYIFSWGKNEYKNEFSDYKNIRVEDIPEPILEVYKEINKL